MSQPMPSTTSKWLRFQESPTKTKTRFFLVISAQHGNNLGAIYWHPQWRQYCFFPDIDTVWSSGCLKDVQDFIDELMAEWRMKA